MSIWLGYHEPDIWSDVILDVSVKVFGMKFTFKLVDFE